MPDLLNIRGNKGINLERLQKAGFRVPVFIVVPQHASEEEVMHKVAQELKGCKLFAVRSSCSDEDAEGQSMAGKFYSQIGVSREAIWQEVQNVKASYNEAPGDVIIQQFIPSTKSGVLFTDDGNGQVLINANLGLCKQVVEGYSCDEYVLNSVGKASLSQIPFAKEYLSYEEGSMLKMQTHKASLKARELKKLSKLVKKLKSEFDTPQDVEWCFMGSRLYMLQARPITRELPKTPVREHFDSANIAESYSGIVLPLTLSFARHIYGQVYKNLLHASGVGTKKLDRHQEVFDNMVSWFYGRLFYNMNSWYKMMAFIPGYQRNKVNLENMITSNIRVDIERDILPPFSFRIGYPLLVLIKLSYFNLSQRAFRKLVHRYIADFRQRDLNELKLEDCRALYHEFDTRLISRWHVPVENDFMVMTFFGLLRKSFENDAELQKALRFESKTSEQIQKIRDLCAVLGQVPKVSILLAKGDREGFQKLIREDQEIQKRLAVYFSEYGGRYANELKLESKDIEEDPSGLFELIKLYSTRESAHAEVSEEQEAESIKPSFTQAMLIRRFRKYAAAREESRLLRSNGFSMMRKLMNQTGILLQEAGRIQKAEDIYFLYLDEIFSEEAELKTLIAGRKKEYESFRNSDPPTHFSLAKGEVAPKEGTASSTEKIIQGKACSRGKIRGRVRVFEEFSFPDEVDFDIVVAKHTDPGWTPLLGVAKGLIVEHGGILSHAAIVSRELNLPTVIGIPHITRQLKTGMLIELDGDLGIIKILDETD